MYKILMALSVIVMAQLGSVRQASAPTFSRADKLAFFIQDHHDRMGSWFEAVGRTKPPPLSRDRAVEYARMFLDLAKRYDLEHELFRVIIPYVTQECGFINTVNDRHLRLKSRGLFGLQIRTARTVAGYCRRYRYTRAWPWQQWAVELISDPGLNADLGFELIRYYLELYDGDADTVYQAMVAGRGGVRKNRRVNWDLFHRHQREALAFQKYLLASG